MAKMTELTVKVDRDIKEQCESLYRDLGWSLPDAVNVFLRQSLRVGGFPFDVRLDRSNKDTAAAMLEAERLPHDPSVTRFSDVEETLRALKR